LSKPNDLFFTYEETGKFLPDQKFRVKYSNVLLSLGGHLVDSEEQYRQLMSLFRLNGDHEFHMFEDFGLLDDETRTGGLQASISSTSDFEDFENTVLASDTSGMAFVRNSYFLFGETKKWAIYLAEFPSILIVCCDDNLASNFREIFGIKSNGYGEIKDFLAKEFCYDHEKIRMFECNYVEIKV
jgi:hypothetical protein